MNLRRVWTIAVKEYVQFFRDRRTVAATVLMPLMQVILYGYLSSDVRYQSTVVWDKSQTAQSRQLLSAFVNSEYFRITFAATSMRDVVRRIESGDALVGIVIPPDYATRLTRKQAPQVLVAVDASDATAAQTSLSVAQAIGNSITGKLVVQQLRMAGVAIPSVGVDIRTRAWYNPALRQDVFIVPGVLALVMQFTMTFLSMSAIVRERELGTLEQLVVSPIRPSELIVGKMIPLMTIGFLNVTAILLLALWMFGVGVAGSVVLLYVTVFVFFFTTLGLGILVSTVAKTYVQAVQLVQFFLMPSMLLSGFIFPVAAMPATLQWLSYLVPLTYFLTIVRGVMIKGVGIDALWPQIALLALFGAAVFSVAVLRFRKRID